MAQAKPEVLDDITVLDLSYKSFAGCYCSSMLAEFGAQVLRIEPPEGRFHQNLYSLRYAVQR